MLPEREVEEFLYRAVTRRWQETTGPQIPEGEVVKDSEQVGVTPWTHPRNGQTVCSWDGLHIEQLVGGNGVSLDHTWGPWCGCGGSGFGAVVCVWHMALGPWCVCDT